MNHIEYVELSPFFNKILNCAEQYALWRLKLIIKYKHCDSDPKWHQLMHELIISYMMLQIDENRISKFRKTRTFD